MGKVDEYRKILKEIADWDSFLLQESRLPGPRANIELARAVAEEGDAELFARFIALDANLAPSNSPSEFLAFCGVLGLGRLLAEGQGETLEILRAAASDSRWRVREAVAMALQRFGRVDMDALLREMAEWIAGNPLEQRAAAAALCEPSMLVDREDVERVLQILDQVTAAVEQYEDRRSESLKVLRKGLGYCWSVAVAAHPEAGKQVMEKWFSSDDRDVRWIMRENLKKKRLARMDAGWVATWQDSLRREP